MDGGQVLGAVVLPYPVLTPIRWCRRSYLFSGRSLGPCIASILIGCVLKRCRYVDYIDVDYIEIVPAPSGAKVTAQTQAESGSLSGTGVSIRKDFAGYEGTGFVGGFTATGDKLAIGFPNVVAGNYNVRIRYHAWGNQQNNVVINGATRSESFAGTGSAWVVKTISNVALTTGSNSIAIVKDWGYVDVDWIEIAP